MGNRFRISLRTSAVLLALLMAGCFAQDKKTAIVQGVQQFLNVKSSVSPKLSEHPPRLVAILPFHNLTGKTAVEEEKGAEFVIRTAFANHFTTRGYETQRTIVTDRLLQEKGLVNPDEIAKAAASGLSDITKADALLYGEITHFNRIYVGVYSQIAVGARLKMVDVKSGEVLWQAEDVSRKHSGGFSSEPLGLVIALASNAWALRHIEVVRASEELFRGIVETIPKARLGETLRPPAITLLVNDSSTLTRKAGDQIKVGIQGEPNMLATFDVGPYRPGVAMTELQPGVYAGTYTVKPGDNADNLIVVGHLADRKGLQTNWEDVLGPVTLDTMPPAVPIGLNAMGRDKTIAVAWKANKEPDLSGYRLYRSETALTGYTLWSSVETPTVVDTKDLINFKRIYYKIAAVDRVGNESPLSEPVAGVPVPPGPTPVSGVISLDSTWYAGASPYVITGEVTVAQGATLTIEPGTLVQSKSAGLTVRGALMAKGTPEQMIVLTAEQETPNTPWRGITFEQTGEQQSVLERVRVSWATVGLTGNASSPKVLQSEFAHNGTGIIVRMAAAHPVFERNQIVLNREDGVSIHDAAAPVLTDNQIAQNARYGVALHRTPGLSVKRNALMENGVAQLWNASSTETVEASGNWWGTREPTAILGRVEGAVSMKDYLDGPPPTGRLVVLPALDSELGGSMTSSAFLLAANSPYLVTKPLVIEKGATLAIQAGVIIKFKAGDNTLVVREGTLRALGTAGRPITLTSANASPRPGDYTNAIRFEGSGQHPSLLQHIRIEYAGTAVQVKDGSPEISHAFIAHNLQSALECGGKSSPKVSYSTLTEHANNAAVICSGRSKPVLYRNNIINNAWGVINHSSLPLEARENWWGNALPDEGLFLGAVEYRPSLKQPEEGAVPK